MTVTWTGFLLPCGRTKANAPCLAVRSLPVETRYIVIVEEGSLKTLQIRQVNLDGTMLTVGVQHGAQVRWSVGTYVIKPFFQVPTPEFWLGPCTRVQGSETRTINWAPGLFPACTQILLEPRQFPALHTHNHLLRSHFKLTVDKPK